MEDNTNVLNEEVMRERGKITLNGYTFTVKPIFLGEDDEFMESMKLSPVPKDDYKNMTDKELGKWAMALFSKAANTVESNGGEKAFNVNLFKLIYRKIFKKYDYTYYSHLPNILPLVYWIERKVTYKGKKVLFYELERKYQLNKAEIEKLFIFLYETSGF